MIFPFVIHKGDVSVVISQLLILIIEKSEGKARRYNCNFILSRELRSISCRSLGRGPTKGKINACAVTQGSCLPVSLTWEKENWLDGVEPLQVHKILKG